MKKLLILPLLLTIFGCKKQDIPFLFSSRGMADCPFGNVRETVTDAYILYGDEMDEEHHYYTKYIYFHENGYIEHMKDIIHETGDTLNSVYDYQPQYTFIRNDYGEPPVRYSFKHNRRKRKKRIAERLIIEETDYFSNNRLVHTERKILNKKAGVHYTYDKEYISMAEIYTPSSVERWEYEYLEFDNNRNWTARIESKYEKGSKKPYEVNYYKREITYAKE